MNAALLSNLLLAAVFSALLFIILKLFNKYKIDNLQGLTFNYITASVFAFLSNYNKNISVLNTLPDLLPFALPIGLLFILVFYATAVTAQKSGVTIASIASKMSMVIPIIAGFCIYNERFDLLRLTGIITALAALYLSCINKNSDNSSAKNSKNIIYPLLVFTGCGIIDTFIKASQHYIMNDANEQLYYAMLFGSAALFGTCTLLYRFFILKEKFQLKNIFAGIILGISNYYSLLFLVRSLAMPSIDSVFVFSMVNMLVVILSAFAAFIIFKEKPSKEKIAGILLAVGSIIILSY